MATQKSLMSSPGGAKFGPLSQAARKSDKNTANTQQVRFFKLYFGFNVFSAENHRLFSIEFQLHTNSHITLWLPVTHHVSSHRALFQANSDEICRLFN